MAQYGVSRNTVRKAVSALTSAGFLDTVSTRGTFVRERRPLTITATRYESDRGVSANDAIQPNSKLKAGRTIGNLFYRSSRQLRQSRSG